MLKAGLDRSWMTVPCRWTHWRRCKRMTQLNKLVDDLHELAVTQTGEFRYTFEALDLHRIAQHCAMTMQARARDSGLTLSTSNGQPLFIQGTNRACSSCCPTCWKTPSATPIRAGRSGWR